MLFCVVQITLSSTMSDTSSTSIGSVGGGRTSEGVRSVSGPAVAEVEGGSPSDEVVRSVTPSSTSQSKREQAGCLSHSPLRAAVNSRALGLYLCPPLPRAKEERFYTQKKGGESNLFYDFD